MTDSQKKANEKYHQKFDVVRFRVPTGLNVVIQERAEELNLSVNQYLNKLVRDDLDFSFDQLKR